MNVLPREFYDRNDVVAIATDLLGKIIITRFDGVITSARIVETEAYNGIIDKASHAFGNRRTNRTEIMYGPPGFAYVYLCYGIHHLFNVVCNSHEIPHAVLIRAVEPVEGISKMLERTGKKNADFTLTRGPGNVSKALGIKTFHTGLDLLDSEILIAEDGFRYSQKEIEKTPRIGVAYAGKDALLPYRFIVKGNKYVSKGKTGI